LAVQNAFPIGRLGTVTSANMFFRQMGGTLGVAVFGAMVAASLAGYARDSLPPGLSALPPAVIEEIASPNLLTSPEQLQAARELVARELAARELIARELAARELGAGAAEEVGSDVARAAEDGIADPAVDPAAFEALVEGLRGALASSLGQVFLVGAALAA